MRPQRVFTEQETAQVFELAASLTLEQMADFFACCTNTLKAVFDRQPEVFDAYRKGRSLAISEIAGSVISAAKGGDMNAARLYLSTKAGWVQTEKREITGADGGPIKQDTHWTIEIVGADD
jgi:hypothetical protein